MKRLFFAVLTIMIVSCKETKSIDYTLFTGKIENPSSEKLTIRNSEGKIVREIKVDENGVFADTIFNTNGYYSFSDGAESSALYLKNGYDLQLKLDTKEFDESIKYTGSGSAENNFLVQKYLTKEKIGTPRELFSADEADFLAKMKQGNEAIKKILKENSTLDKDFLSTETINEKYDYISKISGYKNYHAYLTKNENFTVSETFPNVLEGLAYDNEEHFKISNAYKGLVVKDFYDKATQKSEKDSIDFTAASLAIIKDCKSEIIKNSLLKNIAYEIGAGNPKSEELYHGIMKLSNDSDFKEKLTEKFNKINKLAKGSPSPKFVDYENNAGGKTSLDDLKGKYVYIDVWATWCGPCLAQIPSLKEVEKKYHGKNIEFVSISIDTPKAHDKWKKMIVDKDLKGIQLIAEKNWKSQFVVDYGIEGIPRFILIDPAGNIVNSNAPRPSDPKLIELFNELKI